ncbi:MAG: ABC transporter permease [Spirochaetaceae bacterium]|jgi:molybdate transport system permease protein|nr:ABC transporter permease [Spirochaetaceae bacterium]
MPNKKEHIPAGRTVSKPAYIGLAILLFLFAGTAFSLIFRLEPALIVKVLSQKEIRFALSLSLATSLCSLFLAVIIGLPASWAIVFGKPPFRSCINILLDLPSVMPPLAAGIGLLLLFGHQGIFGKIDPRITVKLFSPLGVIIAQTYLALSIFTRSGVSALMSIDPNYIDAAHNLGLSPGQVFFLVEIPLIWKPLLGGCILAFSRAIGEFGACLMLAGATRMKTETLPMAIFLNIASGDFDAAAVCAVILMAMAGLMLILLHSAQKGNYA